MKDCVITGRVRARAAHSLHASRSRGFTLVELVAVLVIVGVLGALAMPLYQDFRFSARTAAMDQIAVAIQTNMTQTRARYMASGSGASVVINGKTIPVYAPGTIIWGDEMPAGAPTGAGMYLLLDCGDAPVPTNAWVPCRGLRGYEAWVDASGYQSMSIQQPVAASEPPGSMSNCWLYYWAWMTGGWQSLSGGSIRFERFGVEGRYQRGDTTVAGTRFTGCS